MALAARDQLKYWSIATVAFLVALWFLGNVILPFLVGGAMAYMLDPIADRLQRLGLSRTAATSVISVVALLIFVVAALLVIPTLVQQGLALANAAPDILRRLQGFLTDRFPELMDTQSSVRQTLAALGETIRERGGALIQGLLSSLLGVVNAVVFMVVVPVVAFYLLLDWDHLVARIDGLLPREHAPVMRRLALEIDTVLAGFVRGQLSVCATLGIYYATALGLAGLQFGLVVGALTGMVSFIPYVGAIIGGGLAIGLALFQFWGQPLAIGIVVAIFLVGQLLEGNVLVPKMVGHSVGLHPVWLLFALSAFGSVFGFVGLLVAVPVTAALGVLIRFAIAQYTESLLFQGADQAEIPMDIRVEIAVVTPAERTDPGTKG